MIELFKLIGDNSTSIKVDLDSYRAKTKKAERASLYDGYDNAYIGTFWSAESRGVSWTYKQDNISIIETGYKFDSLPTPDLEKVIVIYPPNHHKFSAPRNAVIYNGNGTIHKQVKVPVLISALAKEREERKKNVPVFSDAHFVFVFWRKDSQDNLVASLYIQYDQEFWEQRVLDPKTGHFGECLGSGRV